MADGGWKNADNKMRIIKCGRQNADGKLRMTIWGL